MRDHTTCKNKLDWALWNAEHGWRVFRLKPNAKTPAFNGWQAEATTEPERIRELWSDREFNIGVACGGGLLAADLDVKHGLDGVAVAEFLLGLDRDSTFTVETASGGRHAYLAGPDVPNSVGRVAPGVDIRSAGGYVVGAGSVVDGKRYLVLTPAPLAEAPATLVRWAGEPPRSDGPDPDHNLPLIDLDRPDTIERFTDYLQFRAPLAFEGEGGNQTTFSVAAEGRAQGVSESVALDLMLTHWNERCYPPWEPGELAVTVANGFRYGHGRPGAKHPAAMFAGVTLEPDQLNSASPESLATSRLNLMGGGPRVWPAGLIKGLPIPKVGTGIVAGQSRAGKTFLALYLAGALATHGRFFGRQVRERVGVLYIAAEASGSIAKRLEALRLGKLDGVESATVPIYVAECQDPRELARLMDAARGVLAEHFELRLGAVFIDTIPALFNVEDENDSHLATAAAQAMEWEAKRHACLVLGVSHHGKVAALGLRGSSAWTASVDLLFAATADINEATGVVSNRRLALTKTRDGETGLISAYTLRSVPIGVDEDGEPMESAVVDACDASGHAKKPAVHAVALIQAFDEIRSGGATAPSAKVRELFKEKLGGRIKTSGGVSKALKAAMVSTGLTEITVAGQQVFQLGPAGFAGVVVNSS